ncbi:MAG: hypothetical protein CEN90_485 [Parcubacteria group bacterium Licking1014_17]|nr:MAG: hypothetical protein CEN90_485 [Parcubacteria group bacterium Licking1014_17]
MASKKSLIILISFVAATAAIWSLDIKNKTSPDTKSASYLAQFLEYSGDTQSKSEISQIADTTSPDANQKKITGTDIISPNSAFDSAPTVMEASEREFVKYSPVTTPTATFSPVPTQTKEPTQTKTPTPEPPTNSPAPEQAATPIQSITITAYSASIKQKGSANISIKTELNLNCSIKVTLPSGSVSTAKGLEDQRTSADGTAGWTWKINWNTKTGTAHIDITCKDDIMSLSQSTSTTFEILPSD